jgi:hypothetical protein
MNETLLGVIVGGLIGCIAPLLTLRYGERRWKFEANLAHLKSERDKFELLYEKTIENIESNSSEQALPMKVLADIIILMPIDISNAFDAYFDPNISDEERKSKFWD